MPSKVRQRLIQRHLQSTLISDPVEAAKAAGLRYVSDDRPGIQRRRRGKGFTYINAKGDRIRDPEEIERIKSLAIPPAYKDVWICPLPNGHIQATGRDAKGRKQYRYHPQWRQIRDQTKFSRMLIFSKALPEIRRQVKHDLARRGLPKEKVLAAVVRLMELTQIRIGNEEYARTNESYGLTTLQDEHVDISGSKICFHFRGKSGVEHDIQLSDRRLAKIVKQCQDLPGQELFQYVDEEGKQQTIGSSDVNDYLRAIAGEDFTAKDFRTWAGTILAATELATMEPADSKTATKKQITQAIKSVAKQLGNRPATCRKYYVHPAILDAHQEQSLIEMMEHHGTITIDDDCALRSEEAAVVALLEQKVAQKIQKSKSE